MEREEYDRIAAAEDGHWWYQAVRHLSEDLLGPWLRSDHASVSLDAGCGPGGNGAWLAGYGRVVGVDVAPEAVRFVASRRPGTLPVPGDLAALPIGDGTIDIALAITVLYHLDDDRVGVDELARVLKPGGAALLIEPAFPVLRRAHDTVVHGRRRYRRADLVMKVGAAGLVVERATYAFASLFVPAALLALVDRVRPSSSSDLERAALSGVFARAAAVERRWLGRGHRLAFGTSLIVLATKP